MSIFVVFHRGEFSGALLCWPSCCTIDADAAGPGLGPGPVERRALEDAAEGVDAMEGGGLGGVTADAMEGPGLGGVTADAKEGPGLGGVTADAKEGRGLGGVGADATDALGLEDDAGDAGDSEGRFTSSCRSEDDALGRCG